MAGERAAARQRWQALADAQFTPDLIVWVRVVATALLVADDIPNDSARRGAIPAALGLAGHYRGPRGRVSPLQFEAGAEGRARARARWESIALGGLDRAGLLWVANVATDVLTADNEDSKNARRARLAEAVGLVGGFSPEVEAVRQIARDADHTTGVILRQDGRPAARGKQAQRRRKLVYASLKTARFKRPETVDAQIKRAQTDDDDE